jgi:serine/threonine-protein kinase HipA
MAIRRLQVYLYGKKSGILTDTDGVLAFKYENSAGGPLSVNMPVGEKEYSDRECRFFFENLLPEGEIRAVIAQKERVSEGNVFSLLDKIGGDCAGAVSMYEEGQKTQNDKNRELKQISEDELYGIIDSQKKSPLLTGQNIRLSLAGAQAKFAVYMKDDKMYYPDDMFFYSHLIKPENAGFEDLVINEYFCMKLAERMSITVPNVRLKRLKDKKYLIIDRYDRLLDGNNRERLHQEDFCQILGHTPDRKYQKEGGPGYKECYNFLSDEAGIAQSERFVSMFVYFSILHDVERIYAAGGRLHAVKKPGVITLSPFYDLVATDVYDSLSKEMAMKIGYAWDIRKVQKSDFYRAAEEINIKEKELDRVIQNFLPMPEKARELAQETAAMGFDAGVCEKINKGIKDRLKKISE